MVMLSILFGVISSLVASFIFWFLTFRYSRVNVEFSKAIRKINYVNASANNKYRYAIKFANLGKRSLLEVSIVARLYMNRYNSFTYLSVGGNNSLPILYGNNYRKKNKMTFIGDILGVWIGDVALSEFKRPFYPQKIKNKAKNNSLNLEDLFNELGDDVKLNFYVYGNEEFTGARRVFISANFSKDDIQFVRFGDALDFDPHEKYKAYIDKHYV